MSLFAVPFPIFRPVMQPILSITNSFPAIVVTTIDGVNPSDNHYIDGTIARLLIPPGFGMTQANEKFGTITVINSSTFSIDIDTTFFDIFEMPSNWPLSQQKAQVVPFAEINEILTAAVQNIL